MKDIMEKGKYLISNEKLEKNFHSFVQGKNKNNNNNEFKTIYDNLMKLLILFDKIYLSEISNERFSFILYINMHKMYKSLFLFKREIKSEILEKKNINMENDIKNNYINQYISFIKGDIDKDFIAYNSKNKILLSKLYIKESNNFLIKISKDNIFKEILIDFNKVIEKDKKNKNNKTLKNELNNNKNGNKKSSGNNILAIYSNLLSNTKNKTKKNKIISYEDLILNLSEKTVDFSTPKGSRAIGKCIILNNEYILILLFYKRQEILILINPDYSYTKIKEFEYNKKIFIYPIYNNTFMIIAYEHMYIYEYLPTKQNIQLIFVSTEKYKIQQTYEFNKNYCILIMKQGISFYNWKKNEIIRTLSFSVNSPINQSILVNKFYLVGICDESIFIYNLFNNKLKEYEQHKNLFSFLGNKFDYILNIFNDYFIVWNKFDYHIIKTNFNELKHIYKNSIQKTFLDEYQNLFFSDTKKAELKTLDNSNKNNKNNDNKTINKSLFSGFTFDKNIKLNLFEESDKTGLFSNYQKEEEFDFNQKSNEILEKFKNELNEEMSKNI